MVDNVVASGYFSTVIPIITAIVTALAAIGAIVIGWMGLQTWKEQLKGTSKYNAAYKLLKSVFNVQHAVEALRSRKISASRKEIQAGKNIKEAILRITESVYQTRWDVVNKLMIEFEDKQVDAEVLLGKEIALIGDKFRKCVRDMELDLRMYLEMHSIDGILNDDTFKNAQKTVMASPEGEEDNFNHTMNSIVKQYQAELRKYL
jgi:hypothetical protein